MEKMELKNDKAWEILFKKFKILDRVNKHGFYEMSANQIKASNREPRLMTKFDSSETLPKIFKNNNLAILPTKRGNYIIGKFQNYNDIEINNDVDVVTKFLPEFIETINYKYISSEAVCLNAAYISGMLEDIAGEEIFPTVSGRMGTNEFSYNILLDDNSHFEICVEKSQIEIDGSYEGISKCIILEAKKQFMNDFIIRQLYYPYRVLKSNTSKEVIPIFLIYHDNIFNFFIYSFRNDTDYNSIALKEIRRYILDEPYNYIEVSDIVNIMDTIEFKEEKKGIPFPQANTFEIVLDLLYELKNRDMSKDEISDFIHYVSRQTDYYINSIMYLDLVMKDGKKYTLTEYGKAVMNKNQKERTLAIIRAILSHRPFYVAMKQQFDSFDFNIMEIAKSIDQCRAELNGTTPKRRTSSVTAWIKWILDVATCYDFNKR